MNSCRSAELVVRNPALVWRMSSRCVLVRSTAVSRRDATSELRGAGALVWVAAESPATVADLAQVCGLDERTVAETVELLVNDELLMTVEA